MGEFKTGKIVCMIEGAKIKRGENNPVYSIVTQNIANYPDSFCHQVEI